MDQSPQVRLNSTAHYFLEGLTELGLDYLFCNLGTDHAPLIEEMARWRKAGRAFPKTILCPHENVAMHMAAGYAMATGRGQGVLVHVDVGTGNSAVAMHNAFRGRIPVLLMAGRAPFTQRGELTGSRDTYVHFVQEPYDQASIVRPYVKWEYSLPSGVVAKEALRRAHTMMQSDPKGPVYLMLPREMLAETWAENAVRSYPAGAVRRGRSRGRGPGVDRAARRPADRGEESAARHGVCRARHVDTRAARRARAARRHPRVRIQPAPSQHPGRLAVLRGLRSGQARRRGGPRHPARRRRAVDPARHAREPGDVLGADRRRRGQAGVPDVGFRREPADPGREPADPRAVDRSGEGESDARVPRCGYEARRSARGRARGAENGAREARRGQRREGEDQPAVPLRRGGPSDRAGRHRRERGDPQHARGVQPDPAHRARHDRWA